MKPIDQYTIKVEWSREDDCYLASIPSIPGCLAHGSNRAAAVQQVETLGAALLENSSAFSGKLLLRMPPELHQQLAERAEKEDRSLNKLIVRLLRENI